MCVCKCFSAIHITHIRVLAVSPVDIGMFNPAATMKKALADQQLLCSCGQLMDYQQNKGHSKTVCINVE